MTFVDNPYRESLSRLGESYYRKTVSLGKSEPKTMGGAKFSQIRITQFYLAGFVPSIRRRSGIGMIAGVLLVGVLVIVGTASLAVFLMPSNASTPGTTSLSHYDPTNGVATTATVVSHQTSYSTSLVRATTYVTSITHINQTSTILTTIVDSSVYSTTVTRLNITLTTYTETAVTTSTSVAVVTVTVTTT